MGLDCAFVLAQVTSNRGAGWWQVALLPWCAGADHLNPWSGEMSSGRGGSFTWYMQVQVQEPGSRRLRATLVRERSYSACTKAQLPIVRSMGPAGAYRPRDRARRPASANSRGIAHARLSPARTLPGLGEEAQAHGKRGPIHSRVTSPAGLPQPASGSHGESSREADMLAPKETSGARKNQLPRRM